MVLYGIAKQRDRYKIYFKTFKYIYELSIYKEEAKTIFKNYRTEDEDNIVSISNDGNIIVNSCSVTYADEVKIPEHYAVNFNQYDLSFLRINDFDELIEKLNGLKNITYEKNKFKKIDLYEFIFSDEFKEILNDKNLEFINNYDFGLSKQLYRIFKKIVGDYY